MRRINHDLGGVAQRLTRISDQFDNATQDVAQAWADSTGRAFLQQHADAVPGTMRQLIATLVETAELFENIAHRVKDPNQV